MPRSQGRTEDQARGRGAGDREPDRPQRAGAARRRQRSACRSAPAILRARPALARHRSRRRPAASSSRRPTAQPLVHDRRHRRHRRSCRSSHPATSACGSRPTPMRSSIRAGVIGGMATGERAASRSCAMRRCERGADDQVADPARRRSRTVGVIGPPTGADLDACGQRMADRQRQSRRAHRHRAAANHDARPADAAAAGADVGRGGARSPGCWSAGC